MNPTVYGTARKAGANIVHEVYAYGELIGTRRSAHRYDFAICKRVGPGSVKVKCYSRSAKCSGFEFAVYLHSH